MRLILGISGGVGSGKSTISKIFEELGGFRIDADVLAHEVLNELSAELDLQSLFGDGIVLKDGSVDRKALGQIVFADAVKRQHLEELIHPKVREEIEKRISESKSEIIVLDVPLIDNSPLLEQCTHKIFIKVPDEIRYERVKSRGWSKEKWQKREAAQMPVNEKEKSADWVLDNARELTEVKETIIKWLAGQR
jgi:dephospho-CoA kinase